MHENLIKPLEGGSINSPLYGDGTKTRQTIHKRVRHFPKVNSAENQPLGAQLTSYLKCPALQSNRPEGAPHPVQTMNHWGIVQMKLEESETIPWHATWLQTPTLYCAPDGMNLTNDPRQPGES